jgi:alpha-amylase/alpha-mannosidase (GH57 family)
MKNVRLALLWHMHQPPYREAETGDVLLPWVRLHATRAYHDMAWILERHPDVRCTVNFTPVLLDQLDEQVDGGVRDRFLELSARPAGDLGPAEREAVLRGFFMVDWDRHVRPVRRYWELLQKRGRDLRHVDLSRVAASFTDAELTDLQLHFNLAWMGFAALADDEGLRALRDKGRGYSRDDVAYVLATQRRILAAIVPRWRRLAERGQIELSTTPYYHPILPLLCDTDAARRALPGLPLPPRFSYPEDARWHVREAIRAHARRFGAAPAGMWPAEGAVSPEALEILASEGVRWTASDEGVLLHSLPAAALRLASLYRPWRVAAGAGEIAMLFRDRSLSDLIGFTYPRVPAKDAVADFLAHVGAVGDAWEKEGHAGPATVGVFLDGENAWEHYPESGRDFLDRLYQALEASDRIETVTLSEAALGAVGQPGPPIPRIHSGSWIEASYRIWMGHREDRQAWAALGRARGAVAEAERAGADPAAIERALRHLHAAEASDWYWWYGEDFTTELAAEFDGLFRGHVIRAALLAGATPPAEALEPIKPTGEAGPGGTDAKPEREPSALITPTLDGRETTYFEWQGSGLYRPGQHRGSMYGGAQAFRRLHYGFDLEALYLRLDPAESPAHAAEVATRVRILVLALDRQSAVEFPLVSDGLVREGRQEEIAAKPAPPARESERKAPKAQGDAVGRAAFAQVLEVALPFAKLGLAPGTKAALSVHALRGDVEVERLPRYGFLSFTVPDADFEHLNWRV